MHCFANFHALYTRLPFLILIVGERLIIVHIVREGEREFKESSLT